MKILLSVIVKLTVILIKFPAMHKSGEDIFADRTLHIYICLRSVLSVMDCGLVCILLLSPDRCLSSLESLLRAGILLWGQIKVYNHVTLSVHTLYT